MHPTPDNIPGVDEVTHTLRPSSSPQSLFIPAPSDSIGKDSGEDYEMIGEIRALEVDDTGRIFILAHNIHVRSVSEFGKTNDEPLSLVFVPMKRAYHACFHGF